MGQDVLSVQRLTHGYQDRTLFKNCDFEMEKSERVALIGKPLVFVPFFLIQPPSPPTTFSVSPPAVALAPILAVRFICSATNEPFTCMFFLFQFSINKLCKVDTFTWDKSHNAQSEAIWGKQASTDVKISHRTDHSYQQRPNLSSCCMCCQQIGCMSKACPIHSLQALWIRQQHTAAFLFMGQQDLLPAAECSLDFTSVCLPTLLTSQSAPFHL